MLVHSQTHNDSNAFWWKSLTINFLKTWRTSLPTSKHALEKCYSKWPLMQLSLKSQLMTMTVSPDTPSHQQYISHSTIQNGWEGCTSIVFNTTKEIQQLHEVISVFLTIIRSLWTAMVRSIQSLYLYFSAKYSLLGYEVTHKKQPATTHHLLAFNRVAANYFPILITVLQDWKNSTIHDIHRVVWCLFGTSSYS